MVFKTVNLFRGEYDKKIVGLPEDIHDLKIIFVLQIKKNPVKTSTRTLIRPGMELKPVTPMDSSMM